MLQLDPTDAVPIWRQIEVGVQLLIASGKLAAGAPVPSVRDLARELQVNPATVSKAYQRLVEAEIEAEQVLAENRQAEHHKGEADQPRQRPDGPEGETEQPDGPGDNAAGGGGRHTGEAGEALGQARNGELPHEQNETADQRDHEGRTAGDQQ